MGTQLYKFMKGEKQQPETHQNLIYSNECPSFRTIAKGFGGITTGKLTGRLSNRLIVLYTCSGYNSDWYCKLHTSPTRYGIKFNMVRDSINRLEVVATMQDANWKLKVVPSNTDGDDWNIVDDTNDYFYIYRAFLSSIIEFISVLRTQCQIFSELKNIVIDKVENEPLNWILFVNIFHSLNMAVYKDCFVYKM
jgi:hypothetical protein